MITHVAIRYKGLLFAEDLDFVENGHGDLLTRLRYSVSDISCIEPSQIEYGFLKDGEACFLDRKEAYVEAKCCNQLNGKIIEEFPEELNSEMLK